MTDDLCVSGNAELFKASVHLSLFGLVVTCLEYNMMAYSQRREGHLLRNIVIYGGLAFYEGAQIVHHLRDM